MQLTIKESMVAESDGIKNSIKEHLFIISQTKANLNAFSLCVTCFTQSKALLIFSSVF